MHYLKELYGVYEPSTHQMTTLPLEILIFLLRSALLSDSPTGELCSQTCISCSLIQHCVCILQACTYMYITIWCVIMHDNKTHVPFKEELSFTH